MATDRFVYFKPENFPTSEQLESFLQTLFATAAVIEWNEDTGRFFVSLPGEYSNLIPERNLPEGETRERWIEVIPHDEANAQGNMTIDVLTRVADQFTQFTAFGIVFYLCQVFEGEAEYPETYPTLNTK